MQRCSAPTTYRSFLSGRKEGAESVVTRVYTFSRVAQQGEKGRQGIRRTVSGCPERLVFINRFLLSRDQDPVKPEKGWLIPVLFVVVQQTMLFNDFTGFTSQCRIVVIGQGRRQCQSFTSSGHTFAKSGDHTQNERSFVQIRDLHTGSFPRRSAALPDRMNRFLNSTGNPPALTLPWTAKCSVLLQDQKKINPSSIS